MNKIIFSDNGTLIDHSANIEDYFSSATVIDYTKDEDYIFVGSELPFNSIYVDVSVPNDIASAIKVEYWETSRWRSMVEVIDETMTSGKSLSQSGHITWVPDRLYGWGKDDTVTSSGTEEVTGLGDVTIYDLYWIRLSFSETITATTALKWAGQTFCSSDDVEGEYRLFANTTFKTNYEASKTSWDKEIVLASRLLVDDIISKGSIISGNQLLKRRLLRDACVSKVAELVFKNLGDDYKDDYERAQKEYSARLTRNNYGADLNNDAIVDPNEKGVQTGVLYR